MNGNRYLILIYSYKTVTCDTGSEENDLVDVSFIHLIQTKFFIQ